MSKCIGCGDGPAKHAEGYCDTCWHGTEVVELRKSAEALAEALEKAMETTATVDMEGPQRALTAYRASHPKETP